MTDASSFQAVESKPAPAPAMTAAVVAEKLADNLAPKVAPTEEVKPQVVAPKEDESVSKRFAALARKEQQIVSERQKFSSEKQSFETQRQNLESLRSKAQEEEALWESNPLELLKRRGWTYDKLTQIVLNEGRPTPDIVAKQAAKAEIDAYKKAEEERKRVESEESLKKARQENEKAIAEFRQETNDFVKLNLEKYELVNLHEATEVVLATIEEHFQNTSKKGRPEILSIERACDLVEEYLEGQVEKATQTKKWIAKVSPNPAEPTVKGQTKTVTPTVQTRTTPTLNNNMTTSAASARPLTRDERIKRAMAVKVP